MILAVGMFYLWDGWEEGAMQVLGDAVAFLGSLWLAVRYNLPVGTFLGEKFGVAKVWMEVIGYVTVGLFSQAVISHLMMILMNRVPNSWEGAKINRVVGAFANGVKGAVVMAFVMLVILALPLKGTIRADIRKSVIGGRMVMLAHQYGGEVETSLSEAARQAVKFLTVKPQSSETISLDVAVEDCRLVVDEVTEWKMLDLVNSERAKEGAPRLNVDIKIVAAARAHSRDMFVRKYFSHFSPEGEDVGERMTQAGIKYSLAGENLAYAPDLQTAHTGLMESEGHRRNILEARFGRIGIGVVNGGDCGMMFTQNFAD